MVFLILKTVVPLSEEEAFEKTNIIHENGKAIVYTGTFEHCQKIAAALSKIKVDSEII
jgi:ATP-dependent Clp protease adapter protein ClpS